MQDYSKNTYSRLLSFLEEGFLNSSDKTNYAQYLLTMKDATSIASMIKIYNKVVQKLPSFIYGDKYIPDNWFIYEYWAGPSEYLALELNECLNENILRLYKSTTNPTVDFTLSCISNLRNCINMNKTTEEILSANGSQLSENINTISSVKRDLSKIRSEIINFSTGPIGSNKYKICKEKYLSNIKTLLNAGYIKSILPKIRR